MFTHSSNMSWGNSAAVKAMTRALEIYLEAGRFAVAAKAEKDIAEIYEAEGDLASVRQDFSCSRKFPLAFATHSRFETDIMSFHYSPQSITRRQVTTMKL